MSAGIGFGGQGSTYVTKAGNGLGPKTLIVSMSKTNITQAELNSIVQALGNAGGDGSGTDTGGPDAFVVAGISAFTAGVTDVVYLALKGTGTFTEGSDFGGVTGVTSAIVATFDQNPA